MLPLPPICPQGSPVSAWEGAFPGHCPGESQGWDPGGQDCMGLSVAESAALGRGSGSEGGRLLGERGRVGGWAQGPREEAPGWHPRRGRAVMSTAPFQVSLCGLPPGQSQRAGAVDRHGRGPEQRAPPAACVCHLRPPAGLPRWPLRRVRAGWGDAVGQGLRQHKALKVRGPHSAVGSQGWAQVSLRSPLRCWPRGGRRRCPAHPPQGSWVS